MIQLCAVYEKLTSPIGNLKIKEWKKIYHSNIYQKKSRVSILILLYKVVFRTKKITREREALYTVIKG